MIVRIAMPGDDAAIRGILSAAFVGEPVADLIDDLRRDGDLLLSMVAEDDGRVIGHVGFSRLWTALDGQRFPGVSLAPLAVAADCRRQGIGASLVEAGHEQLRAAGESVVFVLGDPAYYGRFGYSVRAAAAFDCVYAGPHFQVLAFSDRAPTAGAITYASAFDRLQ